MRVAHGIVAVFIAVALVACGDGSGSAVAQTPRALAEELRCIGFVVAPTEELFVREAGRCAYEGSNVRIITFADNEARDSFVEAASTLGGIYVVGDRWAVETVTSGTADAVADVLGGDVR